MEVNGIIKSSSLEASSLAFGSTDTIAGGSNITLTSVLNDIILTTYNATADHIHCTNMLGSRPSVNINPDAGDIDFTVFHDTSTSVPLFHCDADLEKVGIGTITPAARLHVTHDNNEAGIRVEDSSTGTYLEIGESAYTASNAYTGITHGEQYAGSQDYMMISAGTHTLISAKRRLL